VRHNCDTYPDWNLTDVETAFAKDALLAAQDRHKGVLVFDRAEIGEENYYGAGYGRANTRINFYVRVNYEGAPYVARVFHFLKVPHPRHIEDDHLHESSGDRPGGHDKAIRVMMACLYKTTVMDSMLRTDGIIEGEEYYCVLPEAMDGKLVVMKPYDGGPPQFMSYAHLTSR